MARRFVLVFLLLLTLVVPAAADDEPASTGQSDDAAGELAETEAGDAAAARAKAPRTPPPPPRVQMPTGQVLLGPDRELPIRLSNTASARLRIVPIETGEFARLSQFVGSWRRSDDPIEKAGLQARSAAYALSGKPRGIAHLSFDPFLVGRPALVFVALDAPGASPVSAIVQPGEIGTVLKLGDQRGLLWAVETRSGKPIKGARVVIRQGSTVRKRGWTDQQGRLVLPARRRLSLRRGKDADQPLVAYVRAGERVAIASERWEQGIQPWYFGLPYYYHSGRDSIRGMVTAERGIYRPGDEVHLLGTLRQRLPGGVLRPPHGTAQVTVSDPDGTQVSSTKVGLTRFGTLRTTARIPKTARLGKYLVRVQHGKTTLSHRFEVGEYRPVRFEVDVPVTRLTPDEAQDVTIPVEARYLYGAPVGGGQLRWRVSVREATHPGTPGFSYSPRSDYHGWIEQTTGKLELDAQGRGKIRFAAVALDADIPAQKIDVAIEATVQDRAGDVVTAHRVVPHALTDVLVGVRNDRWVVDAKQGWDVEVVAETPDGKAAANTELQIDLERQRWVSVAEKTPWGTRYRGEYATDTVATRTITSGQHPSRLHFDLPGGGEYSLRVQVAGWAHHAEARVWAHGQGATGAWDNHPRIQIRSDKSDYRPGDVARLFVESPYPDATALITIERDGVLRSWVQKLAGASTPVEVPIAERDLPNVFASVAVVPRGMGTKAPATGVPFRMGMKQLTVSPQRRRLRVAIEPERDGYRPGERAEVTVRVRDHRGQPVHGEVTLWAADEGVLKLTGYQTPNPFRAAYAPHPHLVSTATNLLQWAPPEPLEWDGTGGDYGEEDAGMAFRSRLLDTAFFTRRGVVTNAAGEARIRIPLPDNLTRWRVLAVVADAGERFGSAETSLVTSKPVQITPALPRFLTAGDRVDATFLVHNHTGQSGRARVALQVEGAKLVTPPEQEIVVPNESQRAVSFKLAADRRGTVRVSARVRLGGEADGIKLQLPAHAPSGWETHLVGGGRLEGKKTLPLKVPAATKPGMAELSVAISPGVLATLGGGIDSLLEYPHGCVEQTTSRLIPLVMLEDLLRRSGDTRLSSKRHRQRMLEAIAHVLKHQNSDGGFGLWPTSSSEGFLTAYALWGLSTAERYGYPVPGGRLARGYAYLSRNATDGDDMHGQFSELETAPFAAYVLAAGSRDDGSLGTKLAGKSETLSRFAQGLLGTALAKREPQNASAMLANLAASRSVHKRGGALVPETVTGGTFAYGAPVRATATTVHALIAAGKTSQADDLVAGILAERRGDGSWGTTYNNLWALYALAKYAEDAQPLAPATVRLELDGQKVATVRLSRKEPLKTIKLSASDLPGPGQASQLVLVGPAGTPIRFEARLRYVDANAAAHPVDRGFSVQRELLDEATGAPVSVPSQGQLVRVRLTLDGKNSQRQVALMDRLPAGFEPVDTALATTVNRNATKSSSDWVWRELHDDRVTFFADNLSRGTHHAEYLARTTRVGSFVWPAASAEAMYAPDVYGRGIGTTLTVSPK